MKPRHLQMIVSLAIIPAVSARGTTRADYARRPLLQAVGASLAQPDSITASGCLNLDPLPAAGRTDALSAFFTLAVLTIPDRRFDRYRVRSASVVGLLFCSGTGAGS